MPCRTSQLWKKQSSTESNRPADSACCGGLEVDIRRMAFQVCGERILNWTGNVADDAYLQWPVSKFELASLFQSAIGDFALLTSGLWSYRVVALNDGRLSIGWNSFGLIEKSQTVYDFGLETDHHPPGIHLLGDKWFINRFLLKQTETRRGISILRR